MDEQRKRAGEVWATYYLLEAALPLVRCALLHTMPTIEQQHRWWGAVSEHEVNVPWDESGHAPDNDDVLDTLAWQIGRLCEQADEDILRLDGLISEAEPVAAPPPDSAPVSSMDLSFRASTRLEAAGIATIGDLVRCTADDLILIENFGTKSLKEVIGKLQECGLSLKDNGLAPFGAYSRWQKAQQRRGLTTSKYEYFRDHPWRCSVEKQPPEALHK